MQDQAEREGPWHAPGWEADLHASAVVAMRDQLQRYFTDRPDEYIAGNLAVYYEQDGRTEAVASDLFAVLGVPGRERTSYRVWEEGKPPDSVMEVASPRTEKRGREYKRAVNLQLGVAEYWRFDPTGERLETRLQAWRLQGGRSERLAGEADATGGVAIANEVLGLDVRTDGTFVRFRVPRTGKDLLTYADMDRARKAEKRGRDEAGRGREANRRTGSDGGTLKRSSRPRRFLAEVLMAGARASGCGRPDRTFLQLPELAGPPDGTAVAVWPERFADAWVPDPA